MYNAAASASPTQTESSRLRLVEAVATKRRSMTWLPLVIGRCVERLFGDPLGLSLARSVEAETLLILAERYACDALNTPRLRDIVELIALQGAIAVVKRTVCGAGFADHVLREVLIDVIPDFEALAERHPSILQTAKHRV
jgi:hypothetical protein